MDGLFSNIVVAVVGGLILAALLSAIGWAYRNHRTLTRIDRQVNKLTRITKGLIDSMEPEQGKKVLVEWLDDD